MKNKALIIGAGIGGLTTAILLARQKYRVEVFEKNTFAGGRCSGIHREGHRFDLGATLLMMPGIFEQTFESFGRSFKKEIELFRMDPSYRVLFADGMKIDLTSDLVQLKPQLEAIEKGSYGNFVEYMNFSARNFPLAWDNFIDKNYYRFTDMINPGNMALLFRVNAHRRFYGSIGRYFKSDKLRALFTLQSLYIGLNPLTAPGIFSSIPGMELSEGVWFPAGGMNRIAESLVEIAHDHGVKIHLNQPVRKIEVEGKEAIGILLDNGDFHEADFIVSNADLPYTYNHLLPANKIARKLDNMRYSCSALVFHWAVDRIYPQLQQHNVFISADYKKYLDSVFDEKPFTEDPTFYLHSPCRCDTTAAPEGHDSITAIIPFRNLKHKKDYEWQETIEKMRKGVLKRLSNLGIPDFEKNVKFEIVITPDKWQEILNLSAGSTFGSLDHNLFQMCYFRPNNQHRRYRNLFFVGGSAHPGSGVPMTMVSARLTTEKILKEEGKRNKEPGIRRKGQQETRKEHEKSCQMVDKRAWEKI